MLTKINLALTPSHMLYEQALKLCDREIKFDASKRLLPDKINNKVNHFLDRWKNEFLVNLHERQKTKHPNKH